MDEFYPGWMTYEIEEALRQIGGRYARLKRTTILRLAEGAVLRRSMSDTFKLEDTCSETTWYGRYKKGRKKAGWREDPVIQRALKLASQRAQYSSDSYILKQIEETKKLLAQYGPGAVHKLATLMLEATSQNLQRLTALDILDRLGKGEVASKARAPAAGEDDFTDDQRVAGIMALYDSIRARLLPQAGDGQPDLGAAAGSANGDVPSSG